MREFIDAESLKLVERVATDHSADRDTWTDLLLVDHSDVLLKSDRLPPPFRSRHDIVSPQIEHVIPSILQATISYCKYSSVKSTDIRSALHLRLGAFCAVRRSARRGVRANRAY